MTRPKSDRPIRLDSKSGHSPSPMARAGRMGPDLKPTAAADSSWPQLLLRDKPNAFTADIGAVLAVQASDAADGVILLPPEYIDDPRPDLSDAGRRQSWEAKRCWKTTIAYEQISSSSTYPHPHIVPFVYRNPWTAFPILTKPSGPPLDRFLARTKAVFYHEGTSSPPGLQMGSPPHVCP